MNRTKRKLYRVLACALTLAAITALCGCKAQEEIQNVPTPKPATPSNTTSTVIVKQDFPETEHTICVNGRGEVDAKPDFATIRLGVTASGATAEEASQLCAERLTAIREAAISLFVYASDITTTGIEMETRQNEAEEIVGYIAKDNVTLIVRKVESVQNILPKLTDAGASQINAVTYSVTEASAAYKEALTAAMTDAAEKAQVIAGSSGVTVKRVIGVTEKPYDETKIVGVDFESSSITVSAEVEVIYQIG